MEIGNYDERFPTTLHVGNLDYKTSKKLLCTLFSQIGQIRWCKIIRKPGRGPYAFLDFVSHQVAATALAAMNRQVFMDRILKVTWAWSPRSRPRIDISNQHRIFVGGLSPEIDTNTLKEAFAPFGEIFNCLIMRDAQTLKSKGYAFLTFVNKSDAENAIMAMNGQWLGNRSIRTNWAAGNLPLPKAVNPKRSHSNRRTFQEILNESSPTNLTVFCAGVQNGICDELMHKVFAKFGTITNIRVFKEKGYAFIKFTTKECAARAIEAVHLTEVNGYPVKCFWGKKNKGEAASSAGQVMQPMYATGNRYALAPQALHARRFKTTRRRPKAPSTARPTANTTIKTTSPGCRRQPPFGPGLLAAPMQHQAFNSFNPQNSDDEI